MKIGNGCIGVMVKLRIRLDIKIGKKEMDVMYPDNIEFI